MSLLSISDKFGHTIYIEIVNYNGIVGLFAYIDSKC